MEGHVLRQGHQDLPQVQAKHSGFGQQTLRGRKVAAWVRTPLPVVRNHPQKISCRTRKCRNQVSATQDAGQARTVRRKSQYRTDEHTSELQTLMRISYADLCLKNKQTINTTKTKTQNT